jgi:hypothetical protein
LSKPPSPPRYYSQREEELGAEDIGDDDEDDEDYEEEPGSIPSFDDLRDFIDFDPKYNNTPISKKKRSSSRGSAHLQSGDQLRDFLFHDSAKPRKWFSAFAWNTVGAKLAKQPVKGASVR